ncbi:hypothetical protein CgunFtcFv8_013327 [Champsocephalus gunnari]|uniref:Fibronectin type-III domain-containing protein n=1 Tax=Champsocephalus gunnari TaxID=52237 RepID=A0AAN8HUQ2_CHAGU|nr:hypothetical protein CgunFtcFv8_013327 [Champsocephalus gunnari]
MEDSNNKVEKNAEDKAPNLNLNMTPNADGGHTEDDSQSPLTVIVQGHGATSAESGENNPDLSDLEEGGIYFFRVTAENEYGISVPAETKEGTKMIDTTDWETNPGA